MRFVQCGVCYLDHFNHFFHYLFISIFLPTRMKFTGINGYTVGVFDIFFDPDLALNRSYDGA